MAETPELKRIAENTKIQSNVSKSIAPSSPAENTKIQSNVSKSIAPSSPGSLQCRNGYEPMVQTKTAAC
jgi:hypothetical protein